MKCDTKFHVNYFLNLLKLFEGTLHIKIIFESIQVMLFFIHMHTYKITKHRKYFLPRRGTLFVY